MSNNIFKHQGQHLERLKVCENFLHTGFEIALLTDSIVIGLFKKNFSSVQEYVYDLFSTTTVYHIVHKVFAGMTSSVSGLSKNRKLRYNTGSYVFIPLTR